MKKNLRITSGEVCARGLKDLNCLWVGGIFFSHFILEKGYNMAFLRVFLKKFKQKRTFTFINDNKICVHRVRITRLISKEPI